MHRDPDDLLTLDEVALELKVSYEVARKLTVCGRLAYVPVGTGSTREVRRVRRETLDAFKRGEKIAKATREQAFVRDFLRTGAGGASDGAFGGAIRGPW